MPGVAAKRKRRSSHAESRTSTLTQINVVLNWFEELKRKVPVK